ncbi:MAG TPA: UMP kinase [Patescibacteria group bacterium]
MKKETIIISLGGSIIIPDKLDIVFLQNFKKLILKHIRQSRRFFIVTGGGQTARIYQKGAKKIDQVSADDLDWLGIHASRLNAHLLRTIFKKQAHPVVIKEPDVYKRIKEDIIIGAGWQPGWSTDYVCAYLARTYKIKNIVNLSNIAYVYDKDPNKFKQAQKVKKISWPDYRKIVGNKWVPGANFPFDPVAAKLSQKLGLKVSILKGGDLKNFDDYLMGHKFKGTVIN